MPELTQWPSTVAELGDMAENLGMTAPDLLLELERQLGPIPRRPDGYTLGKKKSDRWLGPETLSGRWTITPTWEFKDGKGIHSVEVWLADHKPPRYSVLTPIEALRLAADLAKVATAALQTEGAK